jgi:ubiquinone/menaquinone biosynthesis C-methylase UbiE
VGIDLADRRKDDRHIPTFILDNFIRRMITPPKEKIRKYVSAGNIVADVGCGPGHFTMSMAEAVGPKGKVYAADSDPKSIQVLKAKSKDNGLQDIIESRTTSAANLEFIPDESVDFAFANDVLCCMADHEGALAEIKRILKPNA